MKEKKMSIRISEGDLERIHKKSKAAKLTLTEYVTRACLGKQILVVDGIDEILRQQKAIGKNLNQLTMLCNMGKVGIADLGEMKNQYRKMNEMLSSLLERKR